MNAVLAEERVSFSFQKLQIETDIDIGDTQTAQVFIIPRHLFYPSNSKFLAIKTLNS